MFSGHRDNSTLNLQAGFLQQVVCVCVWAAVTSQTKAIHGAVCLPGHVTVAERQMSPEATQPARVSGNTSVHHFVPDTQTHLQLKLQLEDENLDCSDAAKLTELCCLQPSPLQPPPFVSIQGVEDKAAMTHCRALPPKPPSSSPSNQGVSQRHINLLPLSPLLSFVILCSNIFSHTLDAGTNASSCLRGGTMGGVWVSGQVVMRRYVHGSGWTLARVSGLRDSSAGAAAEERKKETGHSSFFSHYQFSCERHAASITPVLTHTHRHTHTRKQSQTPERWNTIWTQGHP